MRLFVLIAIMLGVMLIGGCWMSALSDCRELKTYWDRVSVFFPDVLAATREREGSLVADKLEHTKQLCEAMGAWE